MPAELEWVEPGRHVGGCLERAFTLGRAPGVLWRPAQRCTPKPPLVLLGHGGSGHKRSDRVMSLAQWFAVRAGLAAVAIDGPYHGARVPAPLPAAVYQALIAEEGAGRVTDRMIADWCSTIEALDEAGLADGGRLAYLGMSMGTRFGLPLAAELGDRLRCLVIGKFGLRQHAAMDPHLSQRRRLAHAAAAITAPVVFHVQWHDEVFPRDGQLELLDAIASPAKRLLRASGGHGETPVGAIRAWRSAVADQLGAVDRAAPAKAPA
jgi:dienelactone hydrolase